MTKKYKSHKPELKLKVALEANNNQKTVNQIASEYEVSPVQVTEWKKQLLSSGVDIFQKKTKKTDAHEDVDVLQKEVGKLTIQLEWLKKKLVIVN